MGRAARQAVATLNLDPFLALVAGQSQAWVEAGASWNVERSPDHGRNKHSAWVTIEYLDRVGVLILWDSGEGELRLANQPSSRASTMTWRCDLSAGTSRSIT